MTMAHTDQDVEKCKEYKTVESLWKTVWLFLKQMVYLPYDPVMELLDTCYREMKKKKIYVHKKTRTKLLTVPSLIKEKYWKQSIPK